MNYVFVIPLMQSAQAFFIPLMQNILNQGDKVWLFTELRTSETTFLWEQKIPEAVKIIDVKIPRIPDLSAIGKVCKEIQKHINAKEKTQIHGHFLMGSLVVARLPKIQNTLRIAHFHGMVGQDLGFLQRKVAHCIERYILKNCDVVFAINQTDFDDIKKYKSAKLLPGFGMGIDAERFVNLNHLLADKENLRQKIGIQKDALVFVFCGRFIATKGFQQIIDGFLTVNNSHKNTHLLLVGQADEAHKTIKIPAHQNITAVGWQTDIAKYFAVADVYVSASIREGFSVSTMEALFAGLPAIIPPAKGLKELIVHLENGYIMPNNNTSSVAEGMTYFAENAHLLPKFSEAAKRNGTHYLRQTAASLQLEIFKNITA